MNLFLKKTMPACIMISMDESLKTQASLTNYLKVGDWSHLNPRGALTEMGFLCTL